MGNVVGPIDARVTQTFVELADTLVADFDLMEFLHTLTDRCVELLDADAAGLLLADQRGSLRLVAASTDRVQVMELFQLQGDEGPCMDCFRSGEVVTVSDVSDPAAARRWPRFTAAATDMGYPGVHAIPMALRADTLGTLNLFRTAPGGLDRATARLAKALVDVATIGILQERAVHHREMVVEQLQTALNTRVAIEQAKGVLAERHGVTPDEAFAWLRRHARSHSRGLADLAAEVIGGGQDAAVDIRPGQNRERT